MSDIEIREPFDITTEKLFCSSCGSECVPRGHLMAEFLLCPNHGEFTFAPIVMHEETLGALGRMESRWMIHHRNKQEKQMWETAKYLSGVDNK